MRKLISNWEYIFAAVAISACLWAFWFFQTPKPKHKCCANISVECDCIPELCRCGGTKTCTESCYQEAKRQGGVK